MIGGFLVHVIISNSISLIMNNVLSKGSAFSGNLFRVRLLDLKQYKSILVVKTKSFLQIFVN